MIDLANQAHWEWSPVSVSAGAAVVTALIALVAVLAAFRQVAEARRLREAQAQPYVTIDLEPVDPGDYQFINLVIENHGSTVARDVKFAFDPALITSDERYRLGERAIFQEGIPVLVPRKRVVCFFDNGLSRNDNADRAERGDVAKAPDRFNVTVSYSDRSGKRYQERYILDLAHFAGARWIGRKTLHDLARYTERIAARLDQWNDGQRLRVWVRDEDEHASVLREFQRRHGRSPHINDGALMAEIVEERAWAQPPTAPDQ